MANLVDLLRFLQPEHPLHLRAASLINIFDITGTAEGRALIFGFPQIIHAILLITEDEENLLAKGAVLSLTNLTAEGGAAGVLEICSTITPSFNLANKALAAVLDPNSELADHWSTVLFNLTLLDSQVVQILDGIQNDAATIARLLDAFCVLDYNQKGAELHYLGPFFYNITQTSRGRNMFCNTEINILEKIAPFVSFEAKNARHGGAVRIFHNFCLDPTYHDKLIDEETCIFQNLLFPLVGPEDVTDEDNEKFPINLQYLGKDKKREEDPELRQMLLECLLQLCGTVTIREFLRSKGVFEILREYHSWEQRVGGDSDALLLCENVIDILIKTEEEIEADNPNE